MYIWSSRGLGRAAELESCSWRSDRNYFGTEQVSETIPIHWLARKDDPSSRSVNTRICSLDPHLENWGFHLKICSLFSWSPSSWSRFCPRSLVQAVALRSTEVFHLQRVPREPRQAHVTGNDFLEKGFKHTDFITLTLLISCWQEALPTRTSLPGLVFHAVGQCSQTQ